MISQNGNGKPAKKPGPKPTWTQDKLDILVRAIGQGHSLRSAAQLVGHTKTTVDSWIRRDPELRTKVRLARGGMSDRAIAALWTFIENGSYPALDRLLTSKVDGFSSKQKVDLKHSGGIEARKGPGYKTPERQEETGETVRESDKAYFERLMALARQNGLAGADGEDSP